MDRRAFLRLSAALGLGPFVGCGAGTTIPAGTRVAILGAGAAGLSAAYLLQQRGATFEVFEAAPVYGGRMKRTAEFVDFPVPLGAEWLHVPEPELARIVNDPSVDITTTMRGYSASDQAGFYDGELALGPTGEAGSDLKFVGSTWFDFFETYIVPSVRSRLRLGTPISSVDSSGSTTVLTDAGGETHEADVVIVTVPLMALRDGEVRFTPELPSDKRNAIASADVWGGLKAFVEFREAFYPTFLSIDGRDSAAGQHLYYDAAYGQRSTAHVLGLFTVGRESERYRALAGDAQRDFFLAELDEIFDGAATRHYVQHIVQDWNAEPFIRQAYLANGESASTARRLFAPVNDRLFFAGEAYTNHGFWGAVDDAARAARAVVDRLGR